MRRLRQRSLRHIAPTVSAVSASARSYAMPTAPPSAAVPGAQAAVQPPTSAPNINTPSFGDVGSMAPPPDLGDIDSQPATGLSIGDLHGPWIMMAGDVQGELFVDTNGFAYYRPGTGIGYGVGSVAIVETVAGTSFRCDLEMYTYEQKSMEPPAAGDKKVLVGIFSKAVAVKHNYTTLTLSGQMMAPDTLDPSGFSAKTPPIAFNAAKMSPWNASEHKPWAPNPEFVEGFKQLFPHSFKISRVHEAVASRVATLAAAPTGSRPTPPQHMDLAPFKVGNVKDVFYIPNYLTESEEQQCLTMIKDTPKELSKQLDRRTVQEYGCLMCPQCQQSFVSDTNQPPWTNEVCDALLHDGIFTPTTFPNNVRIHEYESENGIAPHVDGPIYVPRVAILSLGSPVVMGFYPHRKPYDDAMEHYNDTFRFDGDIAKQRPEFSLILEPRSMMIFESDAYYFYPHGVGASGVDSLREEDAGPIANRHLVTTVPADALEIKRTYRASVTIRNLLPRCAHEPERAEYMMSQAWRRYNHVRGDSGAVVEYIDAGGTANRSTLPSLPTDSMPAAATPVAPPSSIPQPTPVSSSRSSSSVPSAVSSKFPSDPFRQPATPAPSSCGHGAPTYGQAKPPAQQPQQPMQAGSSGVEAAAIQELRREVAAVAQTQKDVLRTLQEVQTVLAHSAQQSASFKSEASAVMDNLTTCVLDMQTKIDDIADRE